MQSRACQIKCCLFLARGAYSWNKVFVQLCLHGKTKKEKIPTPVTSLLFHTRAQLAAKICLCICLGLSDESLVGSETAGGTRLWSLLFCLSYPAGIGGAYSDNAFKSQYSSGFAQACYLYIFFSFGRSLSGQNVTVMWCRGGRRQR